MPKVLRIKARADFLKAAQSGLCYKSGILLVQCRKRDSESDRCGSKPDGCFRVGFTASKKVGNAIVRNRCKRRMRAAADLVLKDIGENSVDYIFIARRMMYSAKWELVLETSRAAVIYLNGKLK